MKKENISYEQLFPHVKRPSRYIGKEYNSAPLKKDLQNKVKICLIFPELYEVGMSYLGIKILYHLLSKQDNVVVDLAFALDKDLAKMLRENNQSLKSLHYKIPLKDFDILGFSLSYELSYTNVLEILDLANIPLYHKDRKKEYPLIIGGGNCTCNPEPIADFFDLFVLGDGEQSIIELLNFYESNVCRDARPGVLCDSRSFRKKNKDELLLEMANKIQGIYVPSLYSINYKDDYRIDRIEKDSYLLRAPQKSVVNDLDSIFCPTDYLLPYVNTVHSNYTVEIQRGCSRGCKFCQAGYVNRPVRTRSKQVIKKNIREGILKTGYSDISLLSLSVIDYPKIEDLLYELVEEYKDKKISISLPSLRCDRFSVEVANLVSTNKKSGLTFAPEAGSQRLRDFINKNVSKEDILESIRAAYENGWKLIKLYFMYGLPSETQEDLEALVCLVKEIKATFPRLRINVGISSFVPKAHTPFQWEEQNSLETLLKKKEFLIHSLRKLVRLKHSREESRIIEGLFSRGDRRLSKLLKCAWEKGACFDQWEEYFDYNIWKEACIETGIDINVYGRRKRDCDEVLPWDILDFGCSKEILKTIRESKTVKSIVCRDARAGVSYDSRSFRKTKRKVEKPNIKHDEIIEKEKYKYRVQYEKQEDIKYISHLEIVDAIKRALNRTGLDIVYSEGFHPLPKVSFGPPNKVGIVGILDFFDFECFDDLKEQEIFETLIKAFPSSIKIKNAKAIKLNALSLDKTIRYAIYKIDISSQQHDFSMYLEKYNNNKEWIIEGKKGKIDIKEIIEKIEIKNHILEIWVDLQKRNLNIYVIIEKIFIIEHEQALNLNISRECII